MKYAYQEESIPQDKRKALNEKVLYLIDSGRCGECSISPEDIYNAYTVIRQIIWSRFRQFIWMCSQVQIAYWSG